MKGTTVVAQELRVKRAGVGIGNFDVKGIPLVAKEFREDANANQKLCIALKNSEQIASPLRDWRRKERRSAMNIALPNLGEGLR
jgi:uncharacterized protein YoaH (UPF0181 family)